MAISRFTLRLEHAEVEVELGLLAVTAIMDVPGVNTADQMEEMEYHRTSLVT